MPLNGSGVKSGDLGLCTPYHYNGRKCSYTHFINCNESKTINSLSKVRSNLDLLPWELQGANQNQVKASRGRNEDKNSN